MFAGFMGGFFEAGLTAILPLMGLIMGWSPTMATLLVAASGIGSAVLMLPAGFMADFLSKPNRQGVPRAFWGNPAHTRLQLMRLAALFTGLGTLTLPPDDLHPRTGLVRCFDLGRCRWRALYPRDDRHWQP